MSFTSNLAISEKGFRVREQQFHPRQQQHSSSSKGADKSMRKVRQITSEIDQSTLEEHYSFLPPNNNNNNNNNDDDDDDNNNKNKTTNQKQQGKTSSSSWQDRMVAHYHSHLYKEYVLADLTRPGQLGLRWRTRQEVESGKGQSSCGNKHCPSYHQQQREYNLEPLRAYQRYIGPITNEQEEREQLEKVLYGLGLEEYEVPFTYSEHGDESKTELVKLSLCLRCAPLLFRKKDDDSSTRDYSALIAARKARQRLFTKDQQQQDEEPGESSDSCGERRKKKRRKKEKKKKRRRDNHK